MLKKAKRSIYLKEGMLTALFAKEYGTECPCKPQKKLNQSIHSTVTEILTSGVLTREY